MDTVTAFPRSDNSMPRDPRDPDVAARPDVAAYRAEAVDVPALRMAAARDRADYPQTAETIAKAQQAQAAGRIEAEHAQSRDARLEAIADVLVAVETFGPAVIEQALDLVDLVGTSEIRRWMQTRDTVVRGAGR